MIARGEERQIDPGLAPRKKMRRANRQLSPPASLVLGHGWFLSLHPRFESLYAREGSAEVGEAEDYVLGLVGYTPLFIFIRESGVVRGGRHHTQSV